MAIQDDVDLDVLKENIQSIKDDDSLSAKDKIKLLKNSYDILNDLVAKFNPLDNEYKTDDMKVGWKVDPSKNSGQTKFELQFDKSLRDDDIEISFKVNGKTEIFQSNKGSDNLKLKAGFKFKF